jgi:Glycosyl hydrolase family 76
MKNRSHRIPLRRLLVATVVLGLAAWAVFNLLPAVRPSQSAAHRRTIRAVSGAFGEGSTATRITVPVPLRAPRQLAGAYSPLLAARQGYGAMKQQFAAPDGLLTKYAQEPKIAGVWSLAQAMDAAVALDKTPGGGVSNGRVEHYFAALGYYWDGASITPGYDKGAVPPLGPGGHKFYDDNALVGLALIHAYGITRDGAMLRRAQQVFDFETTGWDRNPAHPFPGGVFWKQQVEPHDRNAVSTAGAAELGLHLYLLTGRKDDLDWALRMYDWVNTALRAPDGLYWDHVGLAGRIDRTRWSYNQGLMLGDAALLYRATGDRSYLKRARAIASRAVAYYGDSIRLTSQRPIINAIFFANLLALDQLAPSPAYLREAAHYAATLNRTVDRATGVLAFSPRPLLLDQAALVQVNAYVALARRGLNVGEQVRRTGGRFHRKLT